MRKWLVRGAIALFLVGAIIASCYEAATHVGRGWLRGEAFFDGRPTSYWRGRIDRWLTQFASPEEAAVLLAMTPHAACQLDVVVVRVT